MLRFCLLFLILVVCAPAGALESKVLFPASTVSGWRSEPDRIRPSATREGLHFDLHFTREDKRLLAERTGRMDLSGISSFRLRADVANPDALLEATLSFRSGNGWYNQGFTLHQPGPQHLLLPRALFTSEGSPAGWDRIDALRISFWPRSTGHTRVRLSALEAFRDTLWVIDGQSAARGHDETYTSRVTLRHLDRILSNLALPHGVAPLDRLDDARDARLILLPYLPRLTEPQAAWFEQRVRSGARLVVFENESPRLARLLGVDLGPGVASPSFGLHDHLAFGDPAFPRRLYQHAWGLRELHPRDGARVLATWRDSRDQPVPGLNAALLHRNGAWFNAAWRSGDLRAKEETLLALVRHFHPEILPQAEASLRETGSPRAFQQRFGVLPAANRAAHNLRRRAESLQRGGIESLRELDTLLQKAHATSRVPWPAEIRGIWEQQGTGFHPGGWDQTCRILKENGFNAVFPNLSPGGRAHYPSRLLPASKTLELHGDQLLAFSQAARAHGLQAHVWRINWKLDNASPELLARMRSQGRLMLDDQGREIPWLSPSHPDNVQFEIDLLLEILDHAPIDGIQLDYMRYPGREADYGPAARRAFEKNRGRPVARWPADVLGPLREEYQRFRQQQIHNAVERISTAVKARHPRTTLSAAVWGAWPDCSINQAQDWPVWVRNGWVDWIIPMNYTDNPAQLEGWLTLQRAQPGVAARLVSGLGPITTNAELSPAQLLQQMETARRLGTRGYVLFRLDSSLPDRLFPYLRAGISRF